MIERAKIKAAYAKIKLQEEQQPQQPYKSDSSQPNTDGGSLERAEKEDSHQPPSIDPHPSRQVLIDSGTSTQLGHEHSKSDTESDAARAPDGRKQRRNKRPRYVPFTKEAKRAQHDKEAAAKRREEIAIAHAERERTRADRERWRKAMEKSKRRGPNGQMKLGRQSQVLLEKIQRTVAAEKKGSS